LPTSLGFFLTRIAHILIPLGQARRNSGWKATLRQRTYVSAFLSLGCLTQSSSELSPADIEAIDLAGAKGARREAFVKTVRVLAELMLVGAIVFRVYAFLA
jgi:hypothetical protein